MYQALAFAARAGIQTVMDLLLVAGNDVNAIDLIRARSVGKPREVN